MRMTSSQLCVSDVWELGSCCLSSLVFRQGFLRAGQLNCKSEKQHSTPQNARLFSNIEIYLLSPKFLNAKSKAKAARTINLNF